MKLFAAQLSAHVALVLILTPSLVLSRSAQVKPGHSSKLSGDLIYLRSAQSDPKVRSAELNSLPEMVEVDVRLRAVNGSTLATMQASGLELLGVFPRYARVVGRGSFSAIDSIAALEEVVAIQLNQSARGGDGIAASQRPAGLAPCGAPSGNGMESSDQPMPVNIDGERIKIGIISDSFRSALRLSEAGLVTGEGCHRTLVGSEPQVRGELPEEVYIVNDGAHNGDDEGRALAEIIFDLAPQAQLFFHGGGTSIPAMAEAIDTLVDCGVDVLVDDLFFTREPMFQDGIIAQAVDRAVHPPPDEKRVAYFTAAGNQGPFGIKQTYEDSFPPFDETALPTNGFDFHNFGSTRFLPIQLPPGCGVGLVLQWAEPFEDSEAGIGARTDLDLYLCKERDPATCGIGSAAAQGCSASPIDQPSGDPMEVISSSINTSDRTLTLYLAVDHYCGNKSISFRIATSAKRGCEVNRGRGNESGDDLVQFGLDEDEGEGHGDVFTKPQMYGHSMARGVAAVAATPFAEIEDDGTIPPSGDLNVELFSALGGKIEILFDPSGRQLEDAQVRRQPKFTAPDRSDTSFFGSPRTILGVPKTNECREFAGTSASAPYAAAAAALLLQREKRLEPDQIIDILSLTAQRMAEPNRSGAGLIRVEAALDLVQRLPEPPGELRSSFSSAARRATLRWEAVEGIESYNVEIQTKPEGDSEPIVNVTETVFQTPELPEAEGYQWRVQSQSELSCDDLPWCEPAEGEEPRLIVVGGPWSPWVTLHESRQKSPTGIRIRSSSGNGGTP